MTWSIIAKDATTGQIGIAVSTCAFAVGARVPFIETGTGAIASQAFVNPFYGLRGMALLRAGATAQQALDILTAQDEGRGQRQAHIRDHAGRIAAYTGADCVPWCGHLVRETFSVAGNMLAGPEVIAETARVFEGRTDLPFAKRLIAALKAGEAAGGDKRGKQSAALLIHDDEEYALFDLRVDDHADPLAELERLERVAHERYLHYRKVMPRRGDPSGVTNRDDIERLIAQSIAAEAQG
ncbi:DUF1028 domain-containing protein [Rhabdaerophilum sp. SD176]|uniref:DUF1028 domain-containing protein n=1 Tax=Rhabdaerophilum sp. SD176 TaxID=2983548 RepID=UPI0024DFFC8F|nr:DUF1028 domain-containing protein [Rhabdaerophilum sp. SD176]